MKLTLFLLAAILYGQTPPDPMEVLDGARARIRATMQRLPKYTCLQTIDRVYYMPPMPHSLTSCDQMSADRKRGRSSLTLNSTDRLRLEVAQGADREIHSWPGASRFDLTKFDDIVDSGPFGTGAFGGYLVDIFDNDGVHFDFRGEKTRGEKQVLLFGYQVAPEISHYEVRAGDSWVIASYSGTFEIDPESLEIGRVVLQTPELPKETNLCEAASTLDYQPVQIGGGTFLLPRQSQMHMILRDGEETNNTVAFSGCREFHAESEVRFDSPIGMLEVATAPGKPRPPLPSRLGVDLRLTTPIDTDTAAAGDMFAATVVHAVHANRSKEVLIPAGAVVRGRISRVEHHFYLTQYWLIGFGFESVEFDGQSSPFAARIETPDHFYGSLPVDLLVHAPALPPDSIQLPGAKRHVMAAGTVTHWITWTPSTGGSQ